MRTVRKIRKKTAAAISAVLILIICMPFSAAGADNMKVLKADDACSLALSRSEKYKSTSEELSETQEEYKSAIQAAQIKSADTDTFSFSMMAVTDVPDESTLSEDFEYKFKPVALKLQAASLQHSLNVLEYDTKADVMTMYTGLYEKQEKIALEEEKLALLSERSNRSKAGVYAGKTSAADSDELKKMIDDLTSSVATDRTDLISSQQKLGNLIGLDITTGYKFEDPYSEVDITRKDAESLKDRALEYDKDLYDAKLDAESKRLTMNTDYELMNSQYSDAVAPMKTYIETAADGNKPDASAMKSANDEMKAAIEEPYGGSMKILSVKVSKEFLKGSTSGIKYIQDDPDVLMNAINDYTAALNKVSEAEDKAEQNVDGAYSDLAGKRKAYNAALKAENNANNAYIRGNDLKKTGGISEEDFEKLEDDLNSARQDTVKASSEYVKTIVTFDQITAGGVEYLLDNKDSASGIVTYKADGAYYSFRSLVTDNSFEFSIYIPENFATNVTSYELWSGDEQIGARTDISDTITHLNLSTGNTDNVFVRFYDGEEFIDDCKIDPDEESGSITINYRYTVSSDSSSSVGTFTYRTDAATGLTTIRVNLNEEEKAKTFSLRDADGNELLAGKKTDVTDGFSYLSLATGSLDTMQIVFYDKLGTEMYTAHLNTKTMSVIKDVK